MNNLNKGGLCIIIIAMSFTIFASDNTNQNDSISKKGEILRGFYYNINTGVNYTKITNNVHSRFKSKSKVGFPVEFSVSRCFKNNLEINLGLGYSLLNSSIEVGDRSETSYSLDEQYKTIFIPLYFVFHLNRIKLNPSIQTGILYSSVIAYNARIGMNVDNTNFLYEEVPSYVIQKIDWRKKNNLYYVFGIGLNHITENKIIYLKLTYNYGLFNISKQNDEILYNQDIDLRYNHFGNELYMKYICIQFGVSLYLY